jgi:hypothetical protein
MPGLATGAARAGQPRKGERRAADAELQQAATRLAMRGEHGKKLLEARVVAVVGDRFVVHCLRHLGNGRRDHYRPGRRGGVAVRMLDATVAQQCCIWPRNEARFALRRKPPRFTFLVPACRCLPLPRPAESANLAKANPVLCASAASRVIWAAGALVALWTTVLWALD